jgi:hypothetical protein
MESTSTAAVDANDIFFIMGLCVALSRICRLLVNQMAVNSAIIPTTAPATTPPTTPLLKPLDVGAAVPVEAEALSDELLRAEVAEDLDVEDVDIKASGLKEE